MQSLFPVIGVGVDVEAEEGLREDVELVEVEDEAGGEREA